MADNGKRIETTIGHLVDAEPALARLTAVRLDAKTRYHVVKLAKLVAAETKDHFYEPRQEIFKDLGVERDPKPAELAQLGPDKVREIPIAKMGEFSARMKDLAAVPVTLEWGPVTNAMLESYPEFTGADMLALGPLFTMEDDHVDATKT